MFGNPLTNQDLLTLAQASAEQKLSGLNLPEKYILATPVSGYGFPTYRLFDAAYISTGIIDPNRLGTGSAGAGNLYLADDGTWKAVGGGGGGGDMYKATYDVDNDGVVDSAERTEIIVRNSTGSTLTKGTVVYLSGATGNRPNALRAQAHTEATSSRTIGMVEANIANNSDGYIATNGTLHDLDTSAFTAGDAVWLSATTAGAFTSTVPAEPNHAVFIGYIARSHPTQGRIVLHIQNGYEFDELHGVLLTSEANNDLVVYESATALWKNKSIATIFGGTPLITVPTLAQVTTAGNTTTNAITVGGLTVNTNLIYTDTVNGRVGIGTTTPTEKLEVNGNIKATSFIKSGGTSSQFLKADGSVDSTVYYAASNPSGYTTNVGTVTSVSGTGTVSGLTLTGTVTSAGSLTLGGTLTLTSGNVTTALGFTPYNATNPAGYTTNTGTVTSIVAGTGLSGGTITTSGTIALANTTVTAGSYTLASITVDAQGRITAASSGSAGGTGTVTSVGLTLPTGLSVTPPLITTSGTFVVTYTAGYFIPTTTSQTNWDTAYTHSQTTTGSVHGSTTVGGNLLRLANPSAITFLRVNADNTVSSLDAATFRTAIGAGTSSTTGTVTSVSGTGTISGLTLSGTVTTSGSLTLGGTLAVTASNFASQTANTVLAAPNGTAGVPTFRVLVAADIPTLNQNTTGSAASLTTARTLTIGSTGKTFNGTANVSWTLAEIGAYASSNPSGYTTNTGTVTSVATGTGLSGGTITTSGTISLANTAVTPGSYTSANITVDAQGRITAAADGPAIPSGFTGMFTVPTNPPGQQTLDIQNGIIVNVI